MNELLEKIPYDQINDVPEWQRWAAVAGVLALIFGAYFYFFHLDGQANIFRLEGELKTVEIKLAKTKQLGKKLPELKKKVEALEKELKKVRKELPSEREIPYFLKTISKEGIKAGLEFLLFKPEPESEIDFYARVPVRIEVLSTFHNIMFFFDQVRRLPRIVDIEKIIIKVQKRIKAKSTLLRTTCFAVTYKYIEGAEKKPAPKKTKKGKKGKRH